MGALTMPTHIEVMMRSIDWWHADATCFDGERCLQDAAEQPSPEACGWAVARLLVIGAVSAQTGYEPAGCYVAALYPAGDPERAVLVQSLEAGAHGDDAGLAAALHEAARLCASRQALQAARTFAELSSEIAEGCGSWYDAWRSALVLERLADLDECPRAAERWQRRGLMHQRRMRRTRRIG